MSKPIWLLDVDGVINAVNHQPPDGHELIDVQDHRGIEWPIIFRRPLVDFINNIHASGLAEVRWLTTWEHDARLRLAPLLGFDDFEVVERDESPTEDSEATWWKSLAAQRLAMENPERPIIWTDDDIDYAIVNEEIEWMNDLAEDFLVISPRTTVGLTEEDCDKILDFCKAHTARP